MSPVKYHISPKTGRANQCKAFTKGCPLKSEDGSTPPHFDTKEAASAYLEASAAQEAASQGNLMGGASRKKAPKKVPEAPRLSPEERGRVQALDKRLVEVQGEYDEAERRLRRLQEPRELGTLEGAAAKEHSIRITEAVRVRDSKRRAAEALDEQFQKNPWPRVYLVPGGHAHSSPGCPTLTREDSKRREVLMAGYSGLSEEEVVQAAGHRACTHCYKSAPVDATPTSHPSAMRTPGETESLLKRSTREELRLGREAAARQKAPTASGEPLTISWKTGVQGGWGTRGGKSAWVEQEWPREETFKTEAQATAWLVDSLTQEDPETRAEREAPEGAVLAALAEKEGTTPEALREALAPRVKRARRTLGLE